MKLAMICGTRSALRRRPCSNYKRRCERIHCVRKYNGRFDIRVHDLYISTVQTDETETGVSDQRGRTVELHTSGVKRELKLGEGG